MERQRTVFGVTSMEKPLSDFWATLPKTTQVKFFITEFSIPWELEGTQKTVITGRLEFSEEVSLNKREWMYLSAQETVNILKQRITEAVGKIEAKMRDYGK